MLRVVVVDDSPTARELLVQVLGGDPEIEVVGVAKNGQEGVRLTQTLGPDVVTMDIEMPVMNGFEATREIMATAPVPIVIVSISTLAEEAKNAMRALQAGAVTLINKPMGPASPSFARDTKQLLETVKTMAGIVVIRRPPRLSESPISSPAASRSSVGLVAIAASAGGPPALQTVLSDLPANFPVPILIVQHLAQGFTEGFVSWLNGLVALTVKLPESNELMRPGYVYVAPEGRHLGVTAAGSLWLEDSEPLGGFCPSGTFLFRSVAASFGRSAQAVIMTGMGRDGVDGLRDVRREGGRIFAQDEESCVVFGMPGAAVEAKLVDQVLPLERIASELRAYTGCAKL